MKRILFLLLVSIPVIAMDHGYIVRQRTVHQKNSPSGKSSKQRFSYASRKEKAMTRVADENNGVCPTVFKMHIGITIALISFIVTTEYYNCCLHNKCDPRNEATLYFCNKKGY